jgi:hypothetical protein
MLAGMLLSQFWELGIFGRGSGPKNGS